MAKRPVFLALSVLFCVACAITAYAQDAYYFDCPACAVKLGGQGVYGPYPTFDQCRRALATAKSEGFPIVGECYGGPAPSDAGSGLGRVTRPRSVWEGLARGIAVGGGIGGLVANVSYSNDLERTVKGAEMGAGAGLLGATWLNAGDLGPVGTAVSSAIAGAVAAHGWSTNRQLDGAEDTMLRDVAMGAAAAGLAGWGVGAVANSARHGVPLPRGIDLGIGHRRFWLRWLW